jgi:hypothetical protein
VDLHRQAADLHRQPWSSNHRRAWIARPPSSNHRSPLSSPPLLVRFLQVRSL